MDYKKDRNVLETRKTMRQAASCMKGVTYRETRDGCILVKGDRKIFFDVDMSNEARPRIERKGDRFVVRVGPKDTMDYGTLKDLSGYALNGKKGGYVGEGYFKKKDNKKSDRKKSFQKKDSTWKPNGKKGQPKPRESDTSDTWFKGWTDDEKSLLDSFFGGRKK